MTAETEKALELIRAGEPVFLQNPELSEDPAFSFTAADVEDAEARLRRFAPWIAVRFPETGPAGGIIESPLDPIPEMIPPLSEKDGIRFDGIVNGTRHLKEVQRDSKTVLPQKLPNRYRISLHIDDEEAIVSSAGQFGFRAYQLNAEDDQWKEKIIEYADRVRHIERMTRPD